MSIRRAWVVAFAAALPAVLSCPAAFGQQSQAAVAEAVLEDFADILTVTDSGFNDFSGNMGAVNKDSRPYGAARIERVSGRPAMTFRWDFTGTPDVEAYTGVFFSLFGLTDTKVTYDRKTTVTERFPEHSLNLDRVDGILAEPGGARRYLTIGVSLIYQGTAPVDLRLELKDAADGGRFTRFRLQPSAERQTVRWDFRATYTRLARDLDLAQAKVFSLVVERSNQADGVLNPGAGTLIVDRLWFVPDRAETEPATDANLLDLAGRRSCQYFIDWSSRKTASLGIPQDRSTFADLLTVGGIGFALPCYAIAAERGWIDREESARRTVAVLRVLADPKLYCADPVGCAGYMGWLYHFLGPDGRRKQSFDYSDTPAREDRSTVEVSTIDTTLAVMGALAAQSYFSRDTAPELEIRALAQQFYDNVDWAFMLEPKSNRFYYGWKPIEDRDNTEAEFLLPDADGKGHYSSYQGKPQVIDYYTDEGFLMTLLALGSTRQQVPADVHCAPQRQRQNGLVKTWPGSLFTFFFARAFLAAEQFDLRPCPDERPVNWLENSRWAFQEAITAMPAAAWGVSAAEGPTDRYHAYGLPALAIDPKPEQDGTISYYGMVSAASFGDDLRARAIEALRAAWRRGHWHHRFGLPDAFHADAMRAFPAATPASVEAEAGTGDGIGKLRSNASGQTAILLLAGQSRTVPVVVETPGLYRLTVRASNDNYGALETVTVSVDGIRAGSFQPPDTGDFGAGWNVFADSTLSEAIDLLAGTHVLKFDVTGGDGYGVELDRIGLDPVAAPESRPWIGRARFAINEGPAALHIENARSGLVWSLISGNPNIQRAVERLRPLKTVSAASYAPGAASESLVSSFGAGLPERGVTISVLANGADKPESAAPIFNNATQANWVTPSNVAAGAATVTIRGTDASPATGTLVFSRLAPALFSANASGQGVAAANLIRVKDGAQTLEAVAVFDSASGTMAPVPIRFGGEDEQLYLTLYGTGLRGNAGLGGVALRIGGESTPVTYRGAQSTYLGLDQVNAGPLSSALGGRGAVEVDLTVEGQRANTVMVSFQ
jgi:uncharacterized protein (TIGR03437 family)